jgi:hypothetical protein
MREVKNNVQNKINTKQNKKNLFIALRPYIIGSAVYIHARLIFWQRE